MASVMPSATYPKYYRANGKDFVMHNVGEDTSFQSGPEYHAAIQVLTYPKTLILNGWAIIVKSAGEESSARAAYGQA